MADYEATFTAPSVEAGTVLTFQAEATNDIGDVVTDTVTVTVNAAPAEEEPEVVTGNIGDTLVYSLNRLAGTIVNGVPTLGAAAAANAYAGTTGLEVVGALNVAAGNTLPNYRELQGVLNQLAGTTGLAVDAAAASIGGGGGGTGDAYADLVLEDSPILYWRLGEPADSATAVDLSGNGRDGTYQNTPTLGATGLLTGNASTAMEIAANSGECASIASASWMDVDEITVEAWVKFTSAADSTNGDAIASRYTGAGGFPWLLWRNTTGRAAIQFKSAGGTTTNLGDSTIIGVLSTDTVYHIAFTVSATHLTLYVNGAEANTAAITGGIAASTAPIEVGRYSEVGATTPGAVIQEFVIYDHALTTEKLAAHYAAGTGA